jgi:acyl carrier protein
MICTRDDILNVLGTLELKIATNGLDPTQPLGMQGLDSLDMMNLLFSIEEHFGVIVDDVALEKNDWNSVDAIAASVNVLLGTKI